MIDIIVLDFSLLKLKSQHHSILLKLRDYYFLQANRQSLDEKNILERRELQWIWLLASFTFDLNCFWFSQIMWLKYAICSRGLKTRKALPQNPAFLIFTFWWNFKNLNFKYWKSYSKKNAGLIHWYTPTWYRILCSVCSEEASAKKKMRI